jgi:hypothetical protein
MTGNGHSPLVILRNPSTGVTVRRATFLRIVYLGTPCQRSVNAFRASQCLPHEVSARANVREPYPWPSGSDLPSAIAGSVLPSYSQGVTPIPIWTKRRTARSRLAPRKTFGVEKLTLDIFLHL